MDKKMILQEMLKEVRGLKVPSKKNHIYFLLQLHKILDVGFEVDSFVFDRHSKGMYLHRVQDYFELCNKLYENQKYCTSQRYYQAGRDAKRELIREIEREIERI